LGDGEALCEPEGKVNFCSIWQWAAGRGVEVAELWEVEVECAGYFLNFVRIWGVGAKRERKNLSIG